MTQLTEKDLSRMIWKHKFIGYEVFAIHLEKVDNLENTQLIYFLTYVLPKNTMIDIRSALVDNGEKYLILLTVNDTMRCFIESGDWVYVTKGSTCADDLTVTSDEVFLESFVSSPDYPTRAVFMFFDEKGELAGYQETYNVSISSYDIQSVEEPNLIGRYNLWKTGEGIYVNGAHQRSRTTAIDPAIYEGDVQALAFRKDPQAISFQKDYKGPEIDDQP